MRRLEWSALARRELLDIVAYIAADRPRAALEVFEKIEKAGKDLGFMATGRRGRTKKVYEKVVTGTPYLLIYSIRRAADAETIYVLRLIHSARDRR